MNKTNTISQKNNTNSAKTRSLNIELLRILAMFLIVLGHISTHGNLKPILQTFSPNYYIIWGILAFTAVSVNTYILISGYFLSIKDEIPPLKILSLVKSTWFYSVIIFITMLILGQTQISFSVLPHVFMPVLTFSYWFITIYILMYLLAPFYNKLIQNLTKKQFKNLLIIASFICILWPTLFIPYVSKIDGLAWLIWFTYLYFVSAYIHLYYQPSFKPYKFIFGYLILSGILLSSKIILTLILLHFGKDLKGTAFLYSYNSFLVFPASVCLFLAFLNIKIENTVLKKIILFFAPATLAVYLITEQFAMRNFLWKNLFNLQISLNGFELLAYLIGVSILVYIIASFIEHFRIICIKFIKRKNIN